MELKTKLRENLRNNQGISMPEEGFEPTWDYASRWILSPVCPNRTEQSYTPVANT